MYLCVCVCVCVCVCGLFVFQLYSRTIGEDSEETDPLVIVQLTERRNKFYLTPEIRGEILRPQTHTSFNFYGTVICGKAAQAIILDK